MHFESLPWMKLANHRKESSTKQIHWDLTKNIERSIWIDTKKCAMIPYSCWLSRPSWDGYKTLYRFRKCRIDDNEVRCAMFLLRNYHIGLWRMEKCVQDLMMTRCVQPNRIKYCISRFMRFGWKMKWCSLNLLVESKKDQSIRTKSLQSSLETNSTPYIDLASLMICHGKFELNHITAQSFYREVDTCILLTEDSKKDDHEWILGSSILRIYQPDIL
ncbi:unnamed protein product [Albugo candida]|uniref:Uncharacterized protein n=1 Tax=Albugo candida TaxID=65357 RepID=A0A024GKA9_9STRA|nr:unnamed protein product [Albugo candida]|eukprot:CCI47316.1 unnamed protein product [Albugo candida]